MNLKSLKRDKNTIYEMKIEKVVDRKEEIEDL